VRPQTVDELAEALRTCAAEGRPMCPRGGGTKLAWGAAADPGAADLHTTELTRVLEHNVGDFTAVVEAGTRLDDAQAAFAAHGQMLALDPPLGAGDAATVGGILATGDSGPLRHRHGAARDQVLGMTVVLSDGTVARSGGKVIKNVAGYDVAKLVTGSFGTLAVIASVSLRLHPLAARHCTVTASGGEPEQLARAAVELAAAPLEATCFDLRWEDGEGTLLVRFAGVAAEDRAAAVAAGLDLRDADVVADDDALWARQRALQRSDTHSVVKVTTPLTGLDRVVQAAHEADGTLVARAGLGLSWIRVADARVQGLRDALAPVPTTVLDGAARAADPWPPVGAPALALMRRLKSRFDPAGVLCPGVFVGGI